MDEVQGRVTEQSSITLPCTSSKFKSIWFKHSYKNKLHNFGVPERQSYATYFCKDPKVLLTLSVVVDLSLTFCLAIRRQNFPFPWGQSDRGGLPFELANRPG